MHCAPVRTRTMNRLGRGTEPSRTKPQPMRSPYWSTHCCRSRCAQRATLCSEQIADPHKVALPATLAWSPAVCARGLATRVGRVAPLRPRYSGRPLHLLPRSSAYTAVGGPPPCQPTPMCRMYAPVQSRRAKQATRAHMQQSARDGDERAARAVRRHPRPAKENNMHGGRAGKGGRRWRGSALV